MEADPLSPTGGLLKDANGDYVENTALRAATNKVFTPDSTYT
jgi:hypothetical protein